jgi:proton-translocating NADH-quinone oxidoreductase chain L
MIPLISTLLSGIITGTPIVRKIGHRGAKIASVILIGVASTVSGLIWYETLVGGCETEIDVLGPWFSVGTMQVTWEIYVDGYGAQMVLTVTTVSVGVHIYAVVYMREDPNQTVFMSYLGMFTGSMLLLVMSSNMIVVMLGWELIGVSSYLLIGYWSNRQAAAKSALKAIVVNRISDGVLQWIIISIWWYAGSAELEIIKMNEGGSMPTIISTGLLIGCMAKSVQIIFHGWLADSMEGPTPVSALIHAATLVTAGIYVMIRLNEYTNTMVLIVGSVTALMGSMFGLFQKDIKRVIAFSTCSQLGYMMVSAGLGEYGVEAAMGHLTTHASFKAGLFLAAGVVIMSSGGYQHMSRYGGLTGAHCTIVGYLAIIICGLSLMGLPETSGYNSKETIISSSYMYHHPLADYCHSILLLTAFVTCAYTAKLIIQSFMIDYSGQEISVAQPNRPKNALLGLALGVIMIDVVAKIWIGTHPQTGVVQYIPWLVKTIPAGLVIGGVLTATSAATLKTFSLIRFNATRWGLDVIYAKTIVQAVLDIGRISWSTGDKGIWFVNNQHVRI